MHIMNRVPARIEDGVSFVGDTYYQFFRVRPFPYGSLSVQEKRGYWSKRVQFFKNAQLSDLTGQLWLMEKRRNWDEELKQFAKQANPEAYDAAWRMTHSWAELIEYQHSPEYEVILALELDVSKKEVKEQQSIKETLMVTQREFMKLLGFEVDGREYTLTEVNSALNKAKKLRDQAPSWLLVPMKSWEVYDFYRNHYYPGLPLPRINEGIKKDWPSDNSQWIPDAEIEECDGYLILRRADHERYVTCIVPTLFPDGLNPPGLIPYHELFYRVATEMEFPVQATMHWRHMDLAESKEYARKRGLDAVDQIRHIAKAKNAEQERLFNKKGNVTVEDLPEFEIARQDEELEVTRRYTQVRELTAYLKSTKSPMLECHFMFCVYAETKEELKDRIKAVIEKLNECDVMSINPIDDQRALFESWFPAKSWSGFGYKKRMIPEAVAQITMPGATEMIGDRTGVPVGLNRVGQPVLINLPSPIQRDRNANWVITGPQGSGKTHLLNTFAVNAVVFWQARVTIWDVKPERSHWVKDETLGQMGLPGVGHLVSRIALNGNDYPGILDPLRFIKDPFQAREIAINLIDELLPHDDSDFERKISIIEAGTKSLSSNPSMRELLKELSQGDKTAKQIADYLHYCSEYPLGKLIFGEGGELRLPESGIVLIQPENLELPEEKRPENIRQTLSLQVMNCLALYNLDYLFSTPDYSLGIYDEAWTFLGKYAGKVMADKQTRLGRSKNTSLMFASQSALDIPMELMPLISSYICLGTTTQEETKRAMEFLGVDTTNELIEKQLRSIAAERQEEGEERFSSRGYFKDSDNRAGLVEFITPDVELREFFNTRPKALSLA